MPFKISHGGKSWMVEDLTITETVEVETETGETWLEVNPMRSARHAQAILVRFLAREHGLDKAREIVGAMTITAALDCIDYVPDDDRPKVHEDGVPVVDPKAVMDGSATT